MGKAVWYRALFYLLGLLVLALGLTLNTKTGLGVSPIISVPYCISLLAEIRFGDATLVAYCIFVAVELLLQKGKDWVRTLLQIPLSLIFTRILNLLATLLPPQPDSLTGQLLLLLLAILCTGAGAALILAMDLVPNPGDGIVYALASATQKSTGATKNLFDLTMVLLALAISGTKGDLFCGVGIGTLLGVLGVGRVIAWFDRRFRQSARRLTGQERPCQMGR